MDPELQALLEKIEASDADALTKNRAISAATGGRISDVRALRIAATQPSAARDVAPGIADPAGRAARSESRTDAALRRTAERGDSAVSDFGRMVLQGFTFGFADELAGAGAAVVPGGKNYDEAVTASRQRVDDIRTLNPGAALAAEAAGGLPVAGLSMLRLAGAPATVGGRFAAGTGVGAAEGAAYGAGEADPDPELSLGESVRERAGGAGKGAAIGGTAGGILSLAGSGVRTVRRHRAGRRAGEQAPETGQRLADAAREAGDITGEETTIREASRTRRAAISERRFKPLEELGEIDSPAIRETLQSEHIGPVTKKLFPEIADGTRPPTFTELQRIRSRIRGLRDKARTSGDSFLVGEYDDAYADLTRAIGESAEGFDAASGAWAREIRIVNALEDGQRLASKRADVIQEAYDALRNSHERRAFREGLASRFLRTLDEGSRTPKTFEKLLHGRDTRARLRIILGSDEAFEEFETVVRKNSTRRTRR